MVLMVLNNDLTNAHRIDGGAAADLAYDAHAIKRVSRHEAQAVYAITRRASNGTDSMFHLVVSTPSETNDLIEGYAETRRGK